MNHEAGDAPGSGPNPDDDMIAFLEGLNAFAHAVEGMPWPEGCDPANDRSLMLRLFRDYWRMRHRYRRDRERYEGRSNDGYASMNINDFEAFFRHKFRRFVEPSEEHVTEVDVGQHQPDDEHQTEASRDRQDRFRDEWS